VKLPAGRTIPLSPLRRLMGDVLHFSREVPLVAIERHCPIGDVIDARQRLHRRPSWFSIFLKAFALVASRRDELRRAYLSHPWPRLHQHACNVASLAVARTIGGEEGVLFVRVREPEKLSFAAIDHVIRLARTEPVEKVGYFRRQLRLSRWPRPLRHLLWRLALNTSGGLRAQHLGTFGVTGVAALGSASLHLLSPLTTTLTYGVFAENGTVPVRLFYDHRVLDGVQPAAALKELEETLHGPICDELRGEVKRAA
jgi:hypothetical protein